MKKRYCLIRRKDRQGTLYCHDLATGKRESLGTKDCVEAERLVSAKNEALRNPHLNLQIARAFLLGADERLVKRSWDEVFDVIIEAKHGPTQARWQTAKKERPFDLIRHKKLIQTTAEDFLAVLKAGGVSTNVHLRKLHNFALDMDWLPRTIIPKRQWPPVVYREKRGIIFEEHQRIISGEHNPEWKAFYRLLWHLGGSQSDIANLRAEDVNWDEKVIAFSRAKTGSMVHFHFSTEVEDLLNDLPSEGFLLPNLCRMREQDRAKQFIRRCRLVGVKGVSLHSYRYAWAERAKIAGYPERFAQVALGHNSKAVHRAYAKRAQVKLPSLEEYEEALKTRSQITTCTKAEAANARRGAGTTPKGKLTG